MADAKGLIIDKANITSFTSDGWDESRSSGNTTEGSGTFYIYGPVARVYSYAKKGLLLAVAYTYVSIYAYRNGNWVSVGSCNSIRESDDSGSTSNNWYYNYNSANGTDCVFRVDYSIHCNGAGARAGKVTVYSGALNMASDAAYNKYFYGNNLKGVNIGTGEEFVSSKLPSYGNTQGYDYGEQIFHHKIGTDDSGTTWYHTNIKHLCTAP